VHEAERRADDHGEYRRAAGGGRDRQGRPGMTRYDQRKYDHERRCPREVGDVTVAQEFLHGGADLDQPADQDLEDQPEAQGVAGPFTTEPCEPEEQDREQCSRAHEADADAFAHEPIGVADRARHANRERECGRADEQP
jgi:hypothetical protein